MNQWQEAFIHLTPIILTFLITLPVAYRTAIKQNPKRAWLYSSVLISVILGMASILWLFVAKDGLGQMLGLLIYLIAFIINNALVLVLIFLVKRKSSQKPEAIEIKRT